MKIKIFVVVGILLLMYVSFRVGLQYGGTRTFNAFFNQNVNSTATEIGLKVRTLEMLKKGEVEKAEDFLERLIDNDLGFLGVSADNKHLKDKRELLEAISTAKRYRDTHPEHKVEPSLSAGVIKAYNVLEKSTAK